MVIEIDSERCLNRMVIEIDVFLEVMTMENTI